MMKAHYFYIIACILIIGFSMQNAAAQVKNNQNQEKETVYKQADKMPLFNGKDAGEFTAWVANEIKYPAEAIRQKIIGNVLISFIVEKDGSVSTVKVLKSVPTLDEEAVRVVSASPKWTPGLKDGNPVRVSFVIPVNFRTTFPSDEKLRIKG